MTAFGGSSEDDQSTTWVGYPDLSIEAIRGVILIATHRVLAFCSKCGRRPVFCGFVTLFETVRYAHPQCFHRGRETPVLP